MPKRRDGTRFVYELKSGDRWAIYNGMVIIINPDHPPQIIDMDGNVVILSTTADPFPNG